MCPNSEQYDSVCKAEFAEIQTKLDRLDEAVRGNGKPGIQLRLDRLEGAEATRIKLIWVLIGAAAMSAVNLVWLAIAR